jgi:hypothetical protein
MARMLSICAKDLGFSFFKDGSVEIMRFLAFEKELA